MEIFGHALSGLLVAQCLEPTAELESQKTSPYFWPLLGMLASTFPDIDAVTYLFGAEVFARYHQVFTHNVLAFLAAPPLLAWLAWRWNQKRLALSRFITLFWAGMTCHLLGDIIAHWPLRFLEPFLHQGWTLRLIPSHFSIGIAFIFLAGGMIGYVDQVKAYRRYTAVITLLLGIGYVIWGPGW